ncbi:HAMP domain-containing sensor histidine kinase [Paenibacillus sp. GYB004]|uniref:sensor histidine kinase n=1 Tax=Paenibacillus sp. GYB004 TaxID=2994393 RepID=UPI002F966433
MESETVTEHDVFAEEQRILSAARKRLAPGGVPEPEDYGQLVRHYEKLLKTTMKLSRISDIQGRTLKHREQELRAAHAELQNQEQLRKQLVSDISHELRTPITSVQGYVKAFMDRVIEPDEHYLPMVYQKLLTINQLISDLFQLSTLKANQLPLHLEPRPLGRWYESLRFKSLVAERRQVHLLKGPAPDEDELLLLNQKDSAVIYIDSLRIEQVVTNFVDNALKYTPQGGSVRVYGSITASPPEASVLIRPHREPSSPFWFNLFVEDTGEGIDPGELPYIFERFYRGEAPRTSEVQGSGLGLSISREIIGRHGGLIGASSVPGAGSRFHFSIPLYSDAAAAAADR